MLVHLNDRFVRLAFPLQSAATRTLVDTPAEHEALLQLAQLTGGAAKEDASAYVQRPFLFPSVSRFSDGRYGVLYCANSFHTAVRETAFHLARIYTDGNAPPMQTRKTRLGLHLQGRAEDVRRAIDAAIPSAIFDPDPNNYGAAQDFGAKARARAASIHYDSVRNSRGGHCVGAFKPDAVQHARVMGPMALVWNGKRFVEEHTITEI